MMRFDSISRRIPSGHAQVAWSAWTTLGVVTLFHTIGMPLQTYGGLLMYMLTEPITEGGRFGWSNGSVGAALGCFFLVAGLAAPILGAVGDRWGGRRVLLGMALLYGAGMAGLGLMRDEWHFFLVYGGLLSLVFIASIVPMMGLLNPWFQRRLGLAIGVVQSLGSLGSAAFTPIMALLLQRWGWLPTFLAMGLVGSGLMLAALRFYRWRPDAPRRGPSAAAEDTPAVDPRAEERARLVRQQMRSHSSLLEAAHHPRPGLWGTRHRAGLCGQLGGAQRFWQRDQRAGTDPDDVRQHPQPVAVSRAG